LHGEGIVTSLCWEKENLVQIILKFLSLSRYTAHFEQHPGVHMHIFYMSFAPWLLFLRAWGSVTAHQESVCVVRERMASFGTSTPLVQTWKKKRAARFNPRISLVLGEEETPHIACELLPPEPACLMAALKSKVGTAFNSQFIP